MDNGWIQNQIAIYMTNKKLVEFNDKLKPAPIEYYGHIHAQGEKLEDGSRPRSCIGMVLQDYVLNNNTKKFHLPSCSSADDIKDSNREDYFGSREDLIARGYDPCKRCNP